ncbi:MAG: hypothetical protein KAR06_02340, partial [Deltaproteobacteria bacterium]|nr:hypothetical protein [Deltaproteobacteria bacterium]
IRPEKAGEVWKYTRTGEKYAIGVDDDGLFKVSLAIGAMTDRFLDIAHGQNDWVRLCSPVEDDSVERIEIEGVEWSTAMNINGNTFAPSAAKYGLSPFRGLVIRPKMKMILEIPKE